MYMNVSMLVICGSLKSTPYNYDMHVFVVIAPPFSNF